MLCRPSFALTPAARVSIPESTSVGLDCCAIYFTGKAQPREGGGAPRGAVHPVQDLRGLDEAADRDRAGVGRRYGVLFRHRTRAHLEGKKYGGGEVSHLRGETSRQGQGRKIGYVESPTKNGDVKGYRGFLDRRRLRRLLGSEPLCVRAAVNGFDSRLLECNFHVTLPRFGGCWFGLDERSLPLTSTITSGGALCATLCRAVETFRQHVSDYAAITLLVPSPLCLRDEHARAGALKLAMSTFRVFAMRWPWLTPLPSLVPL